MVKVRHAKIEDVESACKIAVEAWGPIFDNYRKLLGDELFDILHKDWKERKTDEIRNHYGKYPEWMLVTEKNREIVGFITFNLDGKRKIGEIGNNAVKPKYQRRGIGTLQYREALEIFKREEMTFATVSTGLDEAHAPARASYEKVGFKKAIPGVTYYMKIP